MGLDLAEVVMDIEDAFGFQLGENDFRGTVGHLQSMVIERLAILANAGTARLSAEYEIESLAVLGLKQSQVNLPLIECVPDLTARVPQLLGKAWWPHGWQMRRPLFVYATLWAVTPITMMSLHQYWILGILISPAIIAILAWITTRWRTRLPPIGLTSVKDLISRAIEHQRTRLPVSMGWIREGVPDREAVNSKILDILSRHTGMDRGAIRAELRLLQDLDWAD